MFLDGDEPFIVGEIGCYRAGVKITLNADFITESKGVRLLYPLKVQCDKLYWIWEAVTAGEDIYWGAVYEVIP